MRIEEAKPPYGLEDVAPAFDRFTRIAKVLFAAVDSHITLVEDGRLWRSRDPGGLPEQDPVVDLVMARGELVWVSDALADPRFATNPVVTGPVGLRFYAAAPLTLSDGTSLGALCVVDRQPRPFDPRLAGCLRDLAGAVAYQCERARAAAELEAARGVLDAFVGTVPVSLVMTDTELRVLKASPRWLQRLGQAEEEVVGRTLYEIAPDYFLAYQDVYDRCLAGETIKADRLRTEFKGETRWLQTEVTPWRDSSGRIAGVIAASHTITDMVEAIEKTERSEQRLNLAMEIADIHVWELDIARGTLEKAGAEDSFFEEPKTFEDLVLRAQDGIDPRDREMVGELWQQHVADGAPYNPTYRVNRSDGREIWAQMAARVLKDDQGQVTRVVGAMQNVTAAKKAEADLLQAKEDAEAANRAKSTFLATMSHEIRTPLNGVLGMAQAMAGEALAPEQRERLDVIRQSGEALLAILNDVLDLSKIEAGKLELEETEFDIAKLAKGAHAAFTELAERKGLNFALAIDADAKGVYRGDSTRLRQILYNLLSNALKFTEQGEVRVCVKRMDAGLRLTVSDTGMGIPEDQLGALFEKFEQADASTTRRFGGTGLGLAICRELATLMGGSIKADSSPGGGSTFTVELPMALVRDQALAETPTEPAAPAVQGGDERRAVRVLAAEDNPINQKVLRALLNQAGIEPFIVDNGVEAVAAWEQGPWDAILMDVQMPEMDGPTATRLIRERERERGLPHTPIIALTANAMAHQITEYLSSGMDDFVSKPIDVGRLFTALQGALVRQTRADQDLRSVATR
jgi:PAS domain S-box-containing protein